MKKLLYVLLSMCLIFCSFSFCFAATFDDYKSIVTSGSSVIPNDELEKPYIYGDYQETRATAVSDATTHTLLNDIIRIFTSTGGTMYNSISEMMSWLTPVGDFNTSHSITEVTLYEIVDYIAWTLTGNGPTVYDNINTLASYIPTISGNIQSALSNPYYNTSNNTSQIKYTNNHSGLVGDRFSYYTPVIQDGGQATTKTNYWNSGTPIGNVALLIKSFADNVKDIYQFRWAADLTHYNDNLTTWDSQGSTLTQVGFTPDSAIQGLYRYLAFTQRDVARLTYVFANDEELEARELAQANQDQVLDDFIDPNGAGAASTNDISAISDLSSGYHDNFGSNASVTGIFDIFDSDHMGWFSQETKNQLDTTASRSKGAESDTPLLDKQIQEIYDSLGVKMP